MSLKDQISNQIKDAMRTQDKFRLGVLRMVLSDIKYAEVAVGADKENSEAIYLKAVEGYQKKLEKSLAELPDPERQRIVKEEIKIVSEFLPKKASAEDTSAAIQRVLAHTEERNFGKLMKMVLEELAGAGDNRVISEQLKKVLG